MLGILLIDKHAGPTSHDVVASIRRKLGIRRVGHAGTLDPLATGLLVVAVGPATRFLQYLPLEPKLYRAEITFGVSTSTFDAEGAVTRQVLPPDDLSGKVDQALPKFLGLIQQLPPMYSAVKREGKALYAYARQGTDVERQPRTIHVGRFSIESWAGPVATAVIECSGGTYIRALADDLGTEIGCGAHLSGLRRLRVGRFSVDDAAPLDSELAKRVVPLREALAPMPVLEVEEESVRALREGRKIAAPQTDSPIFAVAGKGTADVVGIARLEIGGMLQPEVIIPSGVSFG
jgi:tRNA pseudouridine55 synthase